MLNTTRAYNGMVVAPHHLAAQAGASVLRDGGNAIEAMVAAASTIAVVYPHMNGLGGDNFWLLYTPGRDPVGIDACGAAAGQADIAFYRSKGHVEIPGRGPLSALTVAGAVSGWQKALSISGSEWGGTLPLSRLLEDAVQLARHGVPVTGTLATNTKDKLAELKDQPGFADAFLVGGEPPAEGDRHQQPALADTLSSLAETGLDTFYRGRIARSIAADLERVGSPIRRSDLERHDALVVKPLSLELAGHRVFNMPPPTQGLASLMLLGIFARLGVETPEGFDYIHSLVEATKQSFKVRDRYLTDPEYMTVDPASFLVPDHLDKLADAVDPTTALPWPEAEPGGDTVWLGAIDSQGRAVSFIQSIYWEFGSGVVLPETGITWQNRGTSFRLDPGHHNHLVPHRRPAHTIQPALAQLSDGRTMVYGTMGGEGQPQTQAMIFSRYAMYGQDIQGVINAPRWLLGRTWGVEKTNLRIEDRFPAETLDWLRTAGHDVEVIGPYEEIMGHAGAIVLHPDGLMEGAADPRSDGTAAAI